MPINQNLLPLKQWLSAHTSRNLPADVLLNIEDSKTRATSDSLSRVALGAVEENSLAKSCVPDSDDFEEDPSESSEDISNAAISRGVQNRRFVVLILGSNQEIIDSICKSEADG